MLEVVVYFDHPAIGEDSHVMATFDSSIAAMAFKKKLLKHERGINKAEIQPHTPHPHNISFEEWAQKIRHPPLKVIKDECDTCGEIQELQKIDYIESLRLCLDEGSLVCNECYTLRDKKCH